MSKVKVNVAVLRLRVGIVLIVVSWMPIAQVVLYIAHNNGKWTSEETSQLVRAVIWGIQILIGLVGLWLVGQLAVQTAKSQGVKKAPGNLWRLFLHGPVEKSPSNDEAS